MENKENIARLIDVAKRRIGSIDINGLNSIIDPNKDNMLKKNTRELLIFIRRSYLIIRIKKYVYAMIAVVLCVHY
jgi:hypothetical protein